MATEESSLINSVRVSIERVIKEEIVNFAHSHESSFFSIPHPPNQAHQSVVTQQLYEGLFYTFI